MGGSSKPLRPDQGHNTQKTYWLKPESKDVRKQPSLLLITLAYQPESHSLGSTSKKQNLATSQEQNIKKNTHTQHVNRHRNIQLTQLIQLIQLTQLIQLRQKHQNLTRTCCHHLGLALLTPQLDISHEMTY